MTTPPRVIAIADMFPIHPGYKAGTGTYSTYPDQVASAAINAVDTIYLYPFVLTSPITFTGGQLRINTGGAASAAKVGIWANGNGPTNRPLGAPLFADNTGVATTSGPFNAVPLISGTLPAGIYWAGTKFTGTPPTVVVLANTSLYVASMVGLPGSALVSYGISFADAYANSMPTFAEGATFSNVGVPTCPVLGLTT